MKKAARILIESYYGKLTRDFHINKRVTADVAIVGSKRLRNRIAGFLTHLMKRIQAGPIRGISIKLQEEERERRDNYQPDVSVLSMMTTELDPVSTAMVNSLVGSYFRTVIWILLDQATYDAKRGPISLYEVRSIKSIRKPLFLRFIPGALPWWCLLFWHYLESGESNWLVSKISFQTVFRRIHSIIK